MGRMTNYQLKTVLKLAAKTFRNCKTVEEYQEAVRELNEIAGINEENIEKTEKEERGS
jgi:hypothetical protein